MNQYVYHFKPRGMTGSQLIPLNDLQNRHPAAYAEHVKKYKGREQLLQERIPILDCLWNDALHISPINPQIIIDTWRAENLYAHARIPESIEVYKIPVDLLNDESTVYFQSFNFDFKSRDPGLNKFWQFQKSSFKEQTEVEPQQLNIWKADLEVGRGFFWYSHTKHILAKQEIDTNLCELIVCQ